MTEPGFFREDRLGNEDGFTLVEIMVAIVLFSLVVIVSVSALTAVNESTTQVALDTQSKAQLTNLADQIEREVNAASDVFTDSTVTNSPISGVRMGANLTIIKKDGGVISYFPVSTTVPTQISLPGKTMAINAAQTKIKTAATVDLIRFESNQTGTTQNSSVAYRDLISYDVTDPAFKQKLAAAGGDRNAAYRNAGAEYQAFVSTVALTGATSSTGLEYRDANKRYGHTEDVVLYFRDYNNQSPNPVVVTKRIEARDALGSLMGP